MTREDDSGATLVEVLVALGVVAALAGTTVLSLRSAPPNGTAETEARRLAARLETAVDRAITSGESIRLSWNSDGYGFEPIAQSSYGLRSTVAQRDYVLPAGLSLDAPDARQIMIQFDGSSHAVTFSLTDGTQHWQIDFDGIASRVSAVLR